MKSQKGFLLIVAMALIVIFGILSSIIVAMFVSTNIGTTYIDSEKSAEFLAESGLEEASSAFTTATLASRPKCSTLSISNTLSGGSYTVAKATDTANTINPRYAYAALATGIAAGDTGILSISVNDGSVFSPNGGRFYIGKELFRYVFQSGNNLYIISRAQNGTLATDHVAGELVSQYQCVIESVGTYSSTKMRGKQEYQTNIQQPIAFVVGAGGKISRWNEETSELIWNPMATNTAFVFNGISAINYHYAWAVADRKDDKTARIARLDGTAWTFLELALASGKNNVNLLAVDATSELEAWAVGEEQNNIFNIFHWTRDASNSDTNWCRLPCDGKTVSATAYNNNQRWLFNIKMLDTDGDGYADIGVAVGGEDGTDNNKNRGIALYYNGRNWDNLDLPAFAFSRIGRIYGAALIPNGNNIPAEAYFVGRSTANNNEGKLLRIRDLAWSVATIPASINPQILTAVSAIDTNGDGYADFGIAVGRNGRIVTFDGDFNWTAITLSGSPDLWGVAIINPTSAWAVGENGAKWYYNGSTWTAINTGDTSTNLLTGVSAISTTPQNSGWYDDLH